MTASAARPGDSAEQRPEPRRIAPEAVNEDGVQHQQGVLCPSCAGTALDVLPNGDLRCESQIIKNLVPPGLGGNATSAPVPIYGPCGAIFTAARGHEAETRAQNAVRAQAEARKAALRRACTRRSTSQTQSGG